VQILVTATRGSSVARRAALAALTQTTSPEVDAVMRELADRGTPAEQRQVVDYFLRHPGPAALAIAIGWTHEGTRGQRQQGLMLLAHASTPEATSVVAALARTPGPQRTEALAALVQMDGGDPEVMRVLNDVLAEGRPDDVLAITNLLGGTRSPGARDVLIHALHGPTVDGTIAAAQALARIGDQAALEAIAQLARSGDPRARVPALQALVGTGSPEGIAAAEQALASRDPAAAQTAVSALASVGTPQARGLLQRAISDADPAIRRGALQALAQAPDAESESILVSLRSDGDAKVRQLALSGLAAVGTRSALDQVMSAAQAGPADERAMALGLLGSVGDSRATDVLRRAIDDVDPRVATAAIYDAQSTAGPELERQLLDRVLDAGAPTEVRNAAAQVLRQRGGELADSASAQITKLLGEAPPR
jgi:HEAT repeat protein